MWRLLGLAAGAQPWATSWLDTELVFPPSPGAWRGGAGRGRSQSLPPLSAWRARMMNKGPGVLSFSWSLSARSTFGDDWVLYLLFILRTPRPGEGSASFKVAGPVDGRTGVNLRFLPCFSWSLSYRPSAFLVWGVVFQCAASVSQPQTPVVRKYRAGLGRREHSAVVHGSLTVRCRDR